MNTPQPEVRAEGLGISFQPGTWVLRDLCFQVCSGEFLAVVGPSGCGKTTLLRMLAGLVRPTAGRLFFRDASVRRSYVFQESTLLPWRSALDNVVLPLELEGVPKSQRRARALASLTATGLSPADTLKYPRQLSGGMSMRVSLARALVNNPQMLLLDEPFAAVDDLTRQRLNNELMRLWQCARWTAVLVTHNLSDAVYLSQRVWVLTGDSSEPIAEFSIAGPELRDENWRRTSEFHQMVDQLSDRLQQTLVSKGE
jgi:NitT/TauT family transport system ATP-binding protein